MVELQHAALAYVAAQEGSEMSPRLAGEQATVSSASVLGNRYRREQERVLWALL